MNQNPCYGKRLRIISTAAVLWGSAALGAGPELMGIYYLPDEPFPQFAAFWNDGAPVENNAANPNAQAAIPTLRLGSSIHVFIRNTGTQALRIDDVAIEGISLKQAIAFSDQRKKRKPASIFFSALPEQAKKTLIDAGEPIWWRVDPQPLAPGRIGEVTVRLRRAPEVKAVRLELKYGERGLPTAVSVGGRSPRFKSISFSGDLRDLFMYLKHPKTPGLKPVSLALDGADLTSSATIGADAKVDVVPIVVRLDSPLESGSFHCLEARYDDGSAAFAGVRAWYDDMAYGVWGGPPGKESDTSLARAYIRSLHEHNVNLQMPQAGSKALSAFFKSAAGQRFCKEEGVGFVIGDLEKWGVEKPYAYFIHDEPDAGDAHITGLPGGHEVGSLAQWAIERSLGWREQKPAIPQMLNVDLTYKPHNYYVYGELPDILMADPYYQPRLRTAYWQHPERLPVYKTARFVHAISTVTRSAAAPKPTHIILYANRYVDQKNDREFRYPTPEEKRIEVYYALAGGAKGLSYWWFTPGKPAYGLGGTGPDAERLWREVGLIGAEVRTAGPLILRSCPADVPTRSPDGVMVRCLPAGLDAMIVIVLNEQHVNDERRTTITPIRNAEVTVELPSWLTAADTFQINAQGIEPVAIRRSETQVTMTLGTLTLPRMIVLTGDTKLRGRLNELYRGRFAANVAKLLRTARPAAR